MIKVTGRFMADRRERAWRAVLNQHQQPWHRSNNLCNLSCSGPSNRSGCSVTRRRCTKHKRRRRNRRRKTSNLEVEPPPPPRAAATTHIRSAPAASAAAARVAGEITCTLLSLACFVSFLVLQSKKPSAHRAPPQASSVSAPTNNQTEFTSLITADQSLTSFCFFFSLFCCLVEKDDDDPPTPGAPASRSHDQPSNVQQRPDSSVKKNASTVGIDQISYSGGTVRPRPAAPQVAYKQSLLALQPRSGAAASAGAASRLPTGTAVIRARSDVGKIPSAASVRVGSRSASSILPSSQSRVAPPMAIEDSEVDHTSFRHSTNRRGGDLERSAYSSLSLTYRSVCFAVSRCFFRLVCQEDVSSLSDDEDESEVDESLLEPRDGRGTTTAATVAPPPRTSTAPLRPVPSPSPTPAATAKINTV